MKADVIAAALAELRDLADTPEKRKALAVCNIAIMTIIEPSDERIERIRRAHAAMNGTDERRANRGAWISLADEISAVALAWPYLAHVDAKRAFIEHIPGATIEMIDELVDQRITLAGAVARVLLARKAERRPLPELRNEVGKTLRKRRR